MGGTSTPQFLACEDEGSRTPTPFRATVSQTALYTIPAHPHAIVLSVGLEPTHLTAHVPKTCVSTNSTMRGDSFEPMDKFIGSQADKCIL